MGDVLLLNGAQCLGAGGVAAEDDEWAAVVEEGLDALEGELVDEVEGACAVGGTGVVAEVDVVELGHEPADAGEDGESAVAGVEYADGGDG